MIDEIDEGALSGLRVVDFGQYLAGPMVGMLLADNGADVIRVDPPTGPSWDHPVNAVLQRGKRSIVLDLHEAEDVMIARKLIASADVVIEGFRPGTMTRWGLDPSQAVADNAGLIWCSLPGFGSDDPRAAVRGWEGVLCSATGLYPTEAFDTTGGPRYTALPMASTFGAMVASHSIAAALLARERFGHGNLIEIPLHDAGFEAFSTYGEMPKSLEQIEPKVVPDPIRNPALGPKRVYRCADDRFVVQVGAPARGLHRFWEEFLPIALKDRTDSEAEEEATKLLTELFASKDGREWETICQEELQAAFSATQTTAEWLDDQHAHDSTCVLSIDDPILGQTNQTGFGVNLSRTQSAVGQPRRILDADRETIIGELATPLSWWATRQRPSAENGNQPLAGIRVVDFSSILAGPIACRVLAEYGAEVIKVNKTAIGIGKADVESDDALAFIGHRTTNAGKRTIFLDLKSKRGQEIAHAIIDTADIVHVNFTGAAAIKLGVGEDSVRGAHPEVIYSTLNLHARGGWRESQRGHEDLAEAVTGLSLRYGGDTPGMHSIVVNDHGTGHLAAFGMIMALIDRRRTRKGQTIETALSRTAGFHQIPFMIGFEGRIWDEPRGPAAMGWGPLDRLYETSEGFIYLAALEKGALTRVASVEGLTGIVGLPDEELSTELTERFGRRPAQHWEDELRAVDVSAQVYMNIEAVMNSDIAKSRNLSVLREHSGLGPARGIGVVARFSSMPDRVVAPVAAPGWDTEAVLKEFGFADQIEDLVKDEVVAGPYGGART
jgi:crotonobetainyl-CoA:carnitine CoA-transferase CaiB-like acyl-CoA transferase